MRDLFLKLPPSLRWGMLGVLLILLFLYLVIRSSLPDLSGQKLIAPLNRSVIIERDVQGIPTIRAKNREDTAFALGYVHAQERFFQMDLLRRSAAGELSGLFGKGAFSEDRKVKIHRFRERARKIYRKLPKKHYAILQSYTTGVNVGLDNLSGSPFQYQLLRQKPQHWVMEDTLLCVFAMYFELNDELGERERSLAIMKEQLPEQWYRFLSIKGGEWDAPLDSVELPAAETAVSVPSSNLPDELLAHMAHRNKDYQQAPLPGSNNWAIGGALTSDKSAMLANDMHLKLRVPNTWFRASWYLRDNRRVTGVTLPGVPVMVAGSNGNIAWGLTNTYGDWGDVVTLQTNEKQTQYMTPTGWKDFDIHEHTLLSHNGEKEKYLSIESVWGPVVGKNHKGELLSHQWVAYFPDAVNMNFIELEKSPSVDEALKVAPQLGLPPQNLVLADKQGQIGWSVAGPIPKRVAIADESTKFTQPWLGKLPNSDYPQLINPDNHRIWTANNRLFSGKTLDIVGFEGGDLGARAKQIRDGLQAREQFDEKDMLDIQLDARSPFLQRWQQVLLDTVSNGGKTEQSLVASVLQKEPELAAHIDSVAYTLVRRFRKIVISQTIGWIYDALEKNNPQHFKRSSVDRMIEYPAWKMLSSRPAHLVPQGYENWNEFLLAAADQAFNEITNNGQEPLQQQTWGKQRPVTIRHPMSEGIPGLGALLDMPASPLDGDDNMPRIQGSDFGASMRMVVVPGKESEGIMHMPTGQSDHPFSSYYSRGHDDWVAGKPSAFLPGETKWVLTLKALQ